jgi:chromosomal replication initiator protein
LTTVIRDREVLEELRGALSRRIGQPRYQLWFMNRTRLTHEDGVLIVGVPNHFYQEWLREKFGEDVRAAAVSVFGQCRAVRFAIDAELFQEARRQEGGPERAESAVRGPQAGDLRSKGEGLVDLPMQAERPGTTGRRLGDRASNRRWRQLVDFVVGPCNRVAHASAVSVVDSPDEGPNPLVLFGPVGCGKTHLLEGICAGLRSAWPDRLVCFVTAEEFTNRFVHAVRLGKLSAFRKQFRDCDALLFDDLHFLANKRATQEEFLHTLNALQAEERLVVAASDCHPRFTDQFLPELADRLLGGAAWGLTLPDEPTRLNLLRAKSARSQFMVADEILAFMARTLRGNVRELEGAIHTLRHYAQVQGRMPDLPMAHEALADFLRHSVHLVQLSDIMRVLCQTLGLDATALLSKKRGWVYSHPRMLAMYLARKHTGATYTEIGRQFGGRNHSTSVAAEKKVRQWLQEDVCLTLGERKFRVRELIERFERELLR